ncbi:MAG: opioid growth factor receptor-related protein [Planctomycetota bacterium]
MTDPILAFYRGSPDTRGRTLDEILAWDDERLEDVHDYIQWLFPTTRRSDFNPFAPVLTEGTIAAFRADASLRARLRASLERMLRFYGFERVELRGQPVVRRAANWPLRSPQWLGSGDHNHLRITRILDSLSTLGLEEEAKAFYRELDQLQEDGAGRDIDRETFDYWRDAVR